MNTGYLWDKLLILLRFRLVRKVNTHTRPSGTTETTETWHIERVG